MDFLSYCLLNCIFFHLKIIQKVEHNFPLWYAILHATFSTLRGWRTDKVWLAPVSWCVRWGAKDSSLEQGRGRYFKIQLLHLPLFFSFFFVVVLSEEFPANSAWYCALLRIKKDYCVWDTVKYMTNWPVPGLPGFVRTTDVNPGFSFAKIILPWQLCNHNKNHYSLDAILYCKHLSFQNT